MKFKARNGSFLLQVRPILQFCCRSTFTFLWSVYCRLLQTTNKNTSIIIDSLKPYSHYKVSILANTQFGDGEQVSDT